ncbi:MAG: DEAD/DEAH box helicase family protein [Syntrophobacterales bacterium]|nr:DEAD/DEAH box helicase family protein [Syntrophobacterales bacterium]
MQSRAIPIQLGEMIKIPSRGLPAPFERKLHEKLVFTNPEYEHRHNAGLWIGNIPPTISCIRKTRGSYIIPRGFFPELVSICQKLRQPYKVIDIRRSFPTIEVDFHGYLKEYQQQAAEAILERDFATIVGGYKTGKTVIALYTISERKQPTLIMIPKLELLDSWHKKLQIFLQIPEREIGLYVQSKKTIGNRVTIAHTSEVMKHWEELADQFGYVILDDAHRCPTRIITQIIPRFDSMYMLALCHEFSPNDKHSQIIRFYIGEPVYTIDPKSAREGCGVIKAEIIAKPTNFTYPYRSRADYLSMFQQLMEDPIRTELIIKDVEETLKRGDGAVVIVTGGPIQEEIFYRILSERGYSVHRVSIPYELLEAQDEAEPASLSESSPILPEKYDILVLTSRTLVHCYPYLRAVKSLFLAVPLYFSNPLLQALRTITSSRDGYSTEETQTVRTGRIKIFDYVDTSIGLLTNYFRMRAYNYGFPPDVILKQSDEVAQAR